MSLALKKNPSQRRHGRKVWRPEGVEGWCGGKVWREGVKGRCGGKVWREGVEGRCGGKVTCLLIFPLIAAA